MQEQANCPNCGHIVQGFIITFPNPNIRREIEQTVTVNFKQLWRGMDDRRLWFCSRFVYDTISYWEEFYQLADWEIQKGNLSPTGEIEAGEPLSWGELITATPKVFVNDIIYSDQIRMMMQPIVNVALGRTVGYEMLARGVKKDGTVIPPLEMYQAAREQNQLFRLDRVCRIAAIEAATKLPENALVFINFIPTSIYNPQHCLATTIDAVTKCGINHERIVFEVVETDRVQDLHHLYNILSYYRSTGFRCALDDFGEGFSDEETMNALRPDIVKLDRQYVTDIDKDLEKQQMAQAIYRVGRKAGATMLAEGIEREEEAIVLAQIGYHLQQGYWYGRPAWDPIEVSPSKLHRVGRASRSNQ